MFFSLLTALINRKWIFATLIVITAVAVMIRLGIWQLDRLQQRRIFNQHYQEQITASSLEISSNISKINFPAMEYREISVAGIYNFENQVAIRNQSWNNQAGVHLLTPLKVTGIDQSLFIDRGWIPLEDYNTGDWDKYSKYGVVRIEGIIRLPIVTPSFGGRPDPPLEPDEVRSAFNFTNLELISKQIPYPINTTFYIQQSPNPSWTEMPYRTQPEIEITEGPHLSYAVQWFIFAIILGVGYPFFVQRHMIPAQKQAT